MHKSHVLVRSRLKKAQSLAAAGKAAEAIELLAQLCRMDPRNADAWFMQGTLFGKVNQFEPAAGCLTKAIELRPHHGLSYFNLGTALRGLGRLEEAGEAFASALRIDPGRREILRALAAVQLNLGRPREAMATYQRCLEPGPGDAETYGNLATCQYLAGELEGSVSSYRHALALRPEGRYLDGLGAALCQQGRHEEAMRAHREAVRLNPPNARYHSNLLLSLHYLPDITPEQVLEEHRAWARRHERASATADGFMNAPDPDRRLKVGYVSPDFRTHSVAYFFEGLLRSHDEHAVETYCYTAAPQRDETTGRLQQAASAWRDVSAFDDSSLIEQVRRDGIDMLVDLAGHTAGNRLTAFALRAAPVQVTYLGYPATTGLSRMDYRLTDERVDPPGQEVFYSEHLVRLPGCFLCYLPPSPSPSVAPAPVTHNRFTTFGSFNNLAKINAGIVALWSDLLHAVPDSRLLIKNPSLTDEATATRYRQMFEDRKIPADRIELLGLAPSLEAHLDTYRRMDIALDTFPYNGTTTTCEALHMGVPVITLAGEAHAGRVGLSLLASLGLNELIAQTPEDYLARALSLAREPDRICDLRTTLRDRLHTSVLCDGEGFARKVEQAYRQMWHAWCSRQPE